MICNHSVVLFQMDDVKAINLRLYQKNQEFEKTLALKTDTVNQLETRCNRLMEVSELMGLRIVCIGNQVK